MNRLACVLTTITLAFGFCLHTRADAQVGTFYLAEDIGTLGGGYTVGAAINDNGEIGGYATTADGTYHAIRYSTEDGLKIVDTPIAADAWLVQGLGINNAGDVVGAALFKSGGSSGFVAQRGQPMQFLTDALQYVAAYATAINDAGVVTGVGQGNNTFRWYPSGAFDDLGDGQSKISSWAINSSGQLAGFRARFIGGIYSATAFRYSEDLGFVDLGSLGSGTSGGVGINAAGTVVGWSEPQPAIGHAFRALSGQMMEDLGTLGGPGSGATAINDSGTIVGYADLANMQGHAFVYSDAGGMVDLNERVAAGTPRLDIAYGINRSGQIVVTHSIPGQVRTYRLTPTTADLTPPTIDHVTATPATLWPPDDTMRPVVIAVAAYDDRDPAPHCTIANITVVENQQVLSTQSDVSVTGDLSVLLRATRSGTSTDRTYTIGVACVDASNNRATASTTVVVPHDSSKP